MINFSGMLAAALLSLLAAPPVPTRLAVVCSGRAPACGSLEGTVRDKLTGASVTPVPAADLARGLAAPGSDATAEAQLAAERALLEQAESAYYQANWSEARARIDQAEKLQTAEPLASADAPRLLVLRSALQLKQGLKDKAALDAKAAVELDPDYDAASFPPAVQRLVEEAKSNLPTEAILKVASIPPQAEVTVDGRAVKGGSIQVVPGTHTLIARSPGYSTLALKQLKVQADQTVRPHLSVALPATLVTAVGAWLATGATEAPPKALEETAEKAGADALLVLVPDNADKARAVFYSEGKATASSPETAAKLVEWAEKQLAAPVVAAPSPTPGAPPKAVAAAAPLAAAATAPVVPRPQTNPALPPPQTQARPLTRRPAFWMGVGGVAVAIVVVGLLASQGGGGTSQVPNNQQRTTVNVSLP